MKQYISVLMAISTLLFAGNTSACSVPYSGSGAVGELVKQQGGWPISDSKCGFLNKNGLFIDVSAVSTVLDGSSVGWVVVSLVDKNNIKSDHSQVSTYVNTSKASMDIADKLAFNALTDAIAGFDFEKAAKQIATYQKAAKGR